MKTERWSAFAALVALPPSSSAREAIDDVVCAIVAGASAPEGDTS